jgi:hypothetical protein
VTYCQALNYSLVFFIYVWDSASWFITQPAAHMPKLAVTATLEP